MEKTVKWLKFAGALTMILTGAALLVVGQNGQNSLLIVVGFVMAAAGGYLSIMLRPSKFRNYGPQKKGSDKPGEGKPKKEEYNCVLITATGIKFDYAENPQGMPRRLRNDNKEYYFFQDAKPMVLPDGGEYYDPKEYANVLMMPAHKKLFERRNTLLTHLAAGMMVVTIIVIGIFLVIFGAPAPA